MNLLNIFFFVKTALKSNKKCTSGGVQTRDRVNTSRWLFLLRHKDRKFSNFRQRGINQFWQILLIKYVVFVISDTPMYIYKYGVFSKHAANI